MLRELPQRKLWPETAFGMRALTPWVVPRTHHTGLCSGQALFHMNDGPPHALKEMIGKTFTNSRTTAGPNLCGGRNDREVIPAKQNIRR
jgi:hypothetical protein